MSIYSFSVLEQRLYLNTLNGDVSDSEEEASSSDFKIQKETYLSRFKPTSYSFCLNISDACNLRCSYCFNSDKKSRLMSPADAIGACELLFSKFPDGEKYYIDMSGKGEPLLNKSAIEAIAEYCHTKSDELHREVLPMLVCNGTLLDRENVEFLQNLGVLFGVSLDGNRSVHDQYRKDSKGRGTFDAIIRNVMAIEHREYVGCAATLTRRVFPLVEAVEQLSTVFNTLSFRLCRSPLYGLDERSLEGWKREYLRLAERLRKDIDSSNVKIFRCLMNGDDLFGRYLCRMFGNSRTLNRCDGLITRFTCDIDGRIYGCPASFGLKDFRIDADSIHQRSRKELERQVLQCWGCPFKFHCGGECALETFFYGHINRFNCDFKIHLIELAAYLKLYCLRNNPEMYKELSGFCREKKARNRIDPELREFCEKNPNLTFTQAKKEFDSLNKRY